MNENPQCQLCELSATANRRSVCLKGGGSTDAALLIYLDAPTMIDDRRGKSFVSEAADYLRHLLDLMSVSRHDVYVDYVLKCYPKPNKSFGKKAPRAAMIEACSVYRLATLQQLKPKAIIAMGALPCEAFIGEQKVDRFEGTCWIPNEPFVREFVERVWITYSPAYALKDPANAVSIYRTLFQAAEEAGLNPKFNKNAKAFDYGT